MFLRDVSITQQSCTCMYLECHIVFIPPIRLIMIPKNDEYKRGKEVSD